MFSGRVVGAAAVSAVALQFFWVAVRVPRGGACSRRRDAASWWCRVASAGWSSPYRAVLASRIRAQRAYRTSFVLDLASSLLIGLTEFGEVWVIFHNVNVLGGLDFTAVLLLFGLSNLAFSLADMVVGHVDQLPTYIRAGHARRVLPPPAAGAGPAGDQRLLAAAHRRGSASQWSRSPSAWSRRHRLGAGHGRCCS